MEAEEPDAAVTFLEAKLSLQDKWTEPEVDRMTERLTDLLFERRALPKLAQVLEAWIARNPESESPYQRYVSVLLFQDRIEEADQWVTAQLKAPIPTPHHARVPGPAGRGHPDRPGERLALWPGPDRGAVDRAAGRSGVPAVATG